MNKNNAALLFVPFMKDFFKQNFNKNNRLLEIGCGDGTFANALEREGFKNVFKCDIFPCNLKNYSIVNINEEELPFKNDSFNLVYSFFVVEHLENIYHYARECKRVLKNGGNAMVFVPSAASFFDRIYYLLFGESTKYTASNNHINFITDNILIKCFESQGFFLEKRFYSHGLIPFLHIKLPKNKLFGLKKGFLFTGPLPASSMPKIFIMKNIFIHFI